MQAIPFALCFCLGLQFSAILGGLEEWVGLHWLVRLPIAIFLAFAPVIGTLIGMFGAVEAWGWSWGGAFALFVGPFAVNLLAAAALVVPERKHSIHRSDDELRVGSRERPVPRKKNGAAYSAYWALGGAVAVVFGALGLMGLQTTVSSSQEADRSGTPEATATSASAACRIKGGSYSYRRTYYIHTDLGYEKVKPERWFCSEQQARSAGWQRARVR